MSTCDDRRLRDLAVLGHELRNPLAAALTGVATAAAITPAGDARAALLERACRDLDRLGKLLDAYLVLLGGKGPGAAPVDLASLARAVAARRGVATVAFRAGSESLPVTGSAVLLERAIENLVDNALHSGATRVEIHAARRAGQAVLTVADDGPGVAPALRERLFDPFVSGRGSTGLGLALVKDIAVAHGGSVQLVPSAAGARFVLTVPLAEAMVATAAGAGR